MFTPSPAFDSGRGSVPPATTEPRLRLSDFRFSRTPAGFCRVEVELENPASRRLVGRATGASSPTGELRVAAEASLRALESALGTGQRFDLVGVKALRAFDATIVVVAVTPRTGEGAGQQLLGCYLAAEDVNRGAAIAVLNATNRVLGIVARH